MKPTNPRILTINGNLEYQPNIIKTIQLPHNLGQSLWLDNITRDPLNSGTLKKAA
jgi:hypothetical protein